ncbi:MAG: TasA family protein [Bacillota bacterium]
MKTKIALSAVLILLAAALIAGATSAWFTDDTVVPAAEFVAGTVVVDADLLTEGDVPGKIFTNVNPGDCYGVCWEITNEGTKAAQLRVKLDKEWIATTNQALIAKIEAEFGEGVLDDLSTDNVIYTPVAGSDWVMYQDGDDIWLSYEAGPVRGTYNAQNPSEPLDPASVQLCLAILFKGAETDNRYQNAEFILDGTVYAVQASNNAPVEVWGTDWNLTTYDVSSFFTDRDCYTGGSTPIDPDEFIVDATIIAEGNGSVSGLSSYAEGAPVTLTATAFEGFVFVGWDNYGSLPNVEVNGNVLSFTMPAYNVNVTAVFEAEEPTPVFDRYNIINVSGEKRHVGQYYGAKTQGKVTGSIQAIGTDDNILESYNETVSVTVSITLGQWGVGYGSHPSVTVTKTFNVTFESGLASVDSDWFEIVNYHHNGSVTGASIVVN